MDTPPANESSAAPVSRAGELWGGFAAMLVALPSSIAFGIAIYFQLGGEYTTYGVLSGIIGAIVIGLVAPLLGGAPRLISAPCAPAAAVMGALAGTLVRDSGLPPAQAVALLTVTGMLCGVLQMVYGGLGGGKLIKYIPYPVVAGYLSGVGLYIFSSQVPKFLGVSGAHLWEALSHPARWTWPGIVVGLVTIVGMVAAPRLTRKVPATIIGLASGVAAYFALAAFLPELRVFAKSNLFIIGPLFAGGATLASHFSGRAHLGEGLGLADLQQIIMPALTLSLLLSIDTLKTCVVLDNLTRSRHQSNRELAGQGAANLLSALAGGLPGAGTMGATLVNLNSGGKTRWSGVCEGAFVIVALLLLRDLLGWIPIAALAGILMVVAVRMVDPQCLHLLRQKSTFLDFLVIAAVVAVAQISLIGATGAGLALAILLFIREQIRGSVIRRKVSGDQISSKQYHLPVEKETLQQYGAFTSIVELQGSLFFGNTDKLFTALEADLKRCRCLILDFRSVQSVDFTAAHLLEQFAAILGERGGCLALAGLPEHTPTGQNLPAYLLQVGLLDPARHVRTFDSLDAALEWAEDRILEEQRMLARGHEPPLELPEIELLREFEADDTLSALRQCVEERSFTAGQVIFKKGDPADELYLIRRGLVRILLPLDVGAPYLLATFARGNFFGEVAFLDRGARSADAIAETPTDLYCISRARFDQLSQTHPVLGVKLFARLARGLAIRLRYADNELRALKES
jgi:SulP family sulfate permease